MKKNKGFTLIELLVVIAIIGVLATVVLVSLNSAKVRTNDTSVKAALNQVRTQADLFYSTSGTYNAVCHSASDSLVPKGIYGMVYAAGKTNGYTNPVSVDDDDYSQVKCNDAPNGWAAQVPLKGTTGYYCVDYTKKGIITTLSIVDSGDGIVYAVCR